MQDLAIVKALLAAQPDLTTQHFTYQIPAHIAAGADKFYRLVTRPPRHFYEDTSWVYHHWEWSGPRRADEQIYIYTKGQTVPIHRFIWQLTQGPIPDGMFAKPACGKKDCVSAHHLRLRSRTSRGQRITPRDARSIRHLFTMEQPVSARRLAEIFEVTERHIYRIVEQDLD